MLPDSMIDYISEESESVTPTPVQIESTCVYDEPEKNLRKGHTGAGVCWVQWMLIHCGYGVGNAGVDGRFGKATHAAVIQFQKDKQMSPDGIVGPLTRGALKTEYEKKKGE